MTDWQNNRYGVPKSWDEQQREKAKEDFERKYPTKWWHDIVFGWGGILLLVTLAASVIWTIVSLWGALR